MLVRCCTICRLIVTVVSFSERFRTKALYVNRSDFREGFDEHGRAWHPNIGGDGEGSTKCVMTKVASMAPQTGVSMRGLLLPVGSPRGSVGRLAEIAENKAKVAGDL